MKVELIAAISVDGNIAESTEQNSTDWTSKEDLRFFVEKTKAAGVMIMGRTTFQTIGKPLKDRTIIVLTREPEAEEKMDGIEYTNESPEQIIERLKALGIKSVVIAGGGSVYGQFLQAGLVTDLYLTIEPVLFGQTIPLAKGIDRINLRLVDSQPMGDQAIMLHYQPK